MERAGQRASFRTQKTASILAYLAFYQGKLISRESLAESFWPDSEPSLARQSLRMALSDIRSSLRCTDWDPDRCFITDRSTIELLAGGVTTDVGEFRAIAESRASAPSDFLIRAIELYTGRLLPSFQDSWIYPQALELEELYAQTISSLLPQLAATGDLDEAVNLGRRAISICAPREDLHLALMRALAAGGRTAQAVRQYEELEELLDNIWGEPPSEEAQKLFADLPRVEARARRVKTQLGPVSPALETSGDFTQFVGREQELTSLCEILDPNLNGPRLWTLLGLGGAGKTRLATRASELMSDAYEGRVHFVNFAHVDSAGQLLDLFAALAQSSQLEEADVVRALLNRIASQPTLLIFDNLEGIVDLIRPTLEQLIRLSPSLRILNASRVPINSPFERLLKIPPLPLPELGCSLDALRASPSVALLTDAAQAVRQGFAVTPTNAESVRCLCQFVEGLPLAIVLASAKLGTQSPAQVIASLSRRADLKSEQRGVATRQPGVESVVRWSINHLTEDERKAFFRLAYCRGDFPPDLAECLIECHPGEHLETFSKLSLLNWEERDDELSYRMLETIREVALEELECDPAEYRETALSHLRWITELLSRSPKTKPWAEGVLKQSSNVHAALEAGINGDADAEAVWEMAVHLQDVVALTGRPHLWADLLSELLEQTSNVISPATLARAHRAVAETHYALRHIRNAYDHHLESKSAADAAYSQDLKIESRTLLSIPAILLGEYETAETALNEAFELSSEASADTRTRVAAGLAWLHFCRQRPSLACGLLERGVEDHLDANVPVQIDLLTAWGANLSSIDDEECDQKLAQAAALLKRHHYPDLLARHHYVLGWVAWKRGQFQMASQQLDLSLKTYVDHGIALGQTPLAIAGMVAASAGHPTSALWLLARSEQARTKHGMALLPVLQDDYDRTRESLLSQIKPAVDWDAVLFAESVRDDWDFLKAVLDAKSASVG